MAVKPVWATQEFASVNEVFTPSAAGLAIGLVGLILGQTLYSNGRQAQLEDALSQFGSGSDGSGLVAVGAILTLLSTVVLVVFVYRLASNVDLAARVALRSFYTEAKARDAQPAGHLPLPDADDEDS